MFRDRLRSEKLWDRIVSADEAALLITDGMAVGMSGFTRAGEAKAVPLALAERARRDPLKITLMTGASLGHNLDRTLVEAHVIARRLPFQSDPVMREAINTGEVMFIDQHLSETVESLRSGQVPPVDVAVVEATAITEDGGIVPTTSVGNSASFAILAPKVIVEINLSQPEALEGLHDIYIPTKRPSREAIPIMAPDCRIGVPFIPIPAEKIAAIVVTQSSDSASAVEPPDAETNAISGHLTEFLLHEVRRGRLTERLQPLQAGIGTIANAVLYGFAATPFHDLTLYSEVLQDSTFDLIDAGKLTFASGSSMTLSTERHRGVLSQIEHYKRRLVLRPQEISNHPEVIRRLGIIAINTALELDIYGNVNSTHVGGTQMMNGIGGSGDFARNAYMSIFVTKSLAKAGTISRVVPMVSHVDHTEHDVDILVTEIGLADLRGLAPRERAKVIIANCVHPSYRDMLADYYRRALLRGGHTPHLIEEALGWHDSLRRTGRMLP
ncbi:acetyl-CoA hydrolase/transferase family protein (plasmid) [Rhizobium leguminosarum]|jgi:acetyl-CoA hydrolase/succinyl-CoA:acetate CoA-transferase|uniref:acetyl-CoA hydrolase/transferase family protein n=1 Tax=Rhizobium leguminosarum TaxID=384 RepID=UPI00103A80E6|nr:acetyl-CoA hydrolase/transferase family protein [Rhizobium leguminosarum]QIO75960.1 acetyl-CoA hydrolase/transferase family protein [Rhizobium leguminosarum bv. trifolii]QIO82973.1 acetyl-CoA hydrolase/transferase family protein [Rhizobium leguminosarum bv. trifolii]TBY14347.1 acetyl-CoA hydrolase/transferase family protein [Rhizobium leguminosarum bv. viciae]TBY17286.1 acetyl-CoA hydrolase/transferase family protein [Rhizobium leguminosarum bv. viciae]TBY91437.1 acetyl-CoA hydrolase/transf